jgi:hypothetical protein
VPILTACAYPSPDPLAVQAVNDSAGRLAGQIASLAKQLCRHPTRKRYLAEAGIVMGGGVLRQAPYRDVLLRHLQERGIQFAWEELVEDVAGQGALGLAEKARMTG